VRLRPRAHRTCRRRTACSRSSRCSLLRATPRTLRGRPLRRSHMHRPLRRNNRNRRSRELSGTAAGSARTSVVAAVGRQRAGAAVVCLVVGAAVRRAVVATRLALTVLRARSSACGARGSSVLRGARVACRRVRRCIGHGACVGRCRVGHAGPTIRRPATRMRRRRRAPGREQHHGHRDQERRTFHTAPRCARCSERGDEGVEVPIGRPGQLAQGARDA
jgi:hypothetical protein